MDQSLVHFLLLSRDLCHRFEFCLQSFIFFLQLFLAFTPGWIEWYAFDRTDLLALRFVKMAYALGTFGRFYLVDFLSHVNRIVRTLRLAYVAVDAFGSNQQRHIISAPAGRIPQALAALIGTRQCLAKSRSTSP
jgi:hypothetical protein